MRIFQPGALESIKLKLEAGIMKTIVYNGHRIQLPEMNLTTKRKKKVKYDGKVVSSKHSIFSGSYVFRVKEDEEDVDYEIEIGMRGCILGLWYVVRRNGKVIYTDR